LSKLREKNRRISQKSGTRRHVFITLWEIKALGCTNKHFIAPPQFKELAEWSQIMVTGANKICADGKLPNLQKRKATD